VFFTLSTAKNFHNPIQYDRSIGHKQERIIISLLPFVKGQAFLLLLYFLYDEYEYLIMLQLYYQSIYR